MRWIKFTVLLIAAAILQAGFVDIFAIVETKPNILLVLLVFFAIYSEPHDAVITSFAIGFAADLVGITMGPNMIAYGLAGVALAQLHRFVAIRKMVFQGSAVFVLGVICSLMSFFLLGFKGMTAAVNPVNFIIAEPAYSAVVGPFLFLPVAWWMRVDMNSFSKT